MRRFYVSSAVVFVVASVQACVPELIPICGGAECTTDDGGTDATTDALADANGAGDADAATCPTSARPDENDCVFAEKRVVYVDGKSGIDTNAGTDKAAPKKTLGAAVAAAAATRKWVVVCGGTYAESVKVTTDVKGIVGSYDCSTWKLGTGGDAKVLLTSTGPVVDVTGVTSFELARVSVEAADATVAGESSLGVRVTTSTGVVLRSVAIKVGNGAPGAAGAAPGSNYSGAIALNGAGPSGATGGAAVSVKCVDGSTSNGGGGGAGAVLGSTPGGNGGWNPAGTIVGNRTGAGGAAEAGLSTCGPGNAGSDGSAGTSGAGAAAGAAQGTAGGAGKPGLGGGGGGGKGVPVIGGSGGGSGGCGGSGGTGGLRGGSSVALWLESSTVTVDTCDVVTGNGGKGGDGAKGEAGQAGGESTASDCTGGRGGNGAGGGGGGGGAGGDSVGIRYSGGAPTTTSLTVKKGDVGKGGAPGEGGAGGSNALGSGNAGTAGTKGTEGSSADQLPR